MVRGSSSNRASAYLQHLQEQKSRRQEKEAQASNSLATKNASMTSTSMLHPTPTARKTNPQPAPRVGVLPPTTMTTKRRVLPPPEHFLSSSRDMAIRRLRQAGGGPSVIWPGQQQQAPRKPPLAPMIISGTATTLTYVSSSSSSHCDDQRSCSSSESSSRDQSETSSCQLGDDECDDDEYDRHHHHHITYNQHGEIAVVPSSTLHDSLDSFQQPQEQQQERSLVIREQEDADLVAPDRPVQMMAGTDDLADYCCGEEAWVVHSQATSSNNTPSPIRNNRSRQGVQQQELPQLDQFDIVDALCDDLWTQPDDGLDLLTRMINETSLRWKESVAHLPHPSALQAQRQEIQGLTRQLQHFHSNNTTMTSAGHGVETHSPRDLPRPLLPSLEDLRQQPQQQQDQRQLLEQIDRIPVDHIVLSQSYGAGNTSHTDELTVWSGWTQPHISRPEPDQHKLSRKSRAVVPSQVVTDLPLTLQAANGRKRRALYTGTVETVGNHPTSPRAVTGEGTLKFSSGDVYTGQVVAGEMHGRGAYQKCRSGTLLAGRFEHNVYVG